MAKLIKKGDPLPRFKATDSEGYKVADEDIVGSPIVIFFYAKNDSERTEQEIKSFRDNMKYFDKMNTLVIGVSPDFKESHQALIKKHKLNFALFSDENKELCRIFGVLKDNKVVRSTFVVDCDGIIQWIEKPVKILGHVKRVFQAVKKHLPKRLNIKTIHDEYLQFIEESKKKKK